MLIGEPAPTQADIHFRLFGFPVRVHPFFWVVSLLLGLRLQDPVKVLIWMAVVFVSILVHELGHAFLQRYFGGHPWITLYHFGGLASCNDCDRRTRSQIAILLAGPGAGFLLAAAVFLLVRLSGHQVGLLPPGETNWDALGISALQPVWLGPVKIYFESFASPYTDRLFANLLYVNILWGLVNLLPIYPLDGGQIARELMTLGNARRGILRSLQLSACTAGAMALVGLVALGDLFVAILFGYLAYTNLQTMRAYEENASYGRW